ncbi:MAG TPA: tetratricopeptide repeat protein [Ktedonobacterales bacterium]|nr:tetratricopeptide repeat protein [Ktedonobacterales bacterium]
MPASELDDLITTAERLSPERSPAQALELNQQVLQLDPTNAAAHVRLARAYQSQREFAEAKAACQEALRLNPGSTVAKGRLQRISEEWELAKEAQATSTWDDAFQRGVEQKADEYAGQAIAYLWRAVELSTSRWQSVACRTALGAAYRALKDPLSLERAAAQYELVLQHVPDDLPAKKGLAAVLRDQGELSQARRLYEQVLAVAPNDSHALNGLAGVLHDAGDEVGAQERFKQSGRPPFVRRPSWLRGLVKHLPPLQSYAEWHYQPAQHTDLREPGVGCSSR